MNSLRDRIYIIGISLGTNCSCVVLNSRGEWVCGYEEERFTKNKRESSFPINSLNKCLVQIPYNSFLKIGLSHWFDNNIKQVDRYMIDIKSYVKKCGFNIIGDIVSDIDHHYLHHLSSLAFINFFKNEKVNFLIIDGFGNNQNTISIYRYENSNCLEDVYIKNYKEFKICNLYQSLGLFYESLTIACGLKPKGDEYKLLGYESSVDRYYSRDELEDYINQGLLIFNSNKKTILNKDYLNFNSLKDVDKCWSEYWSGVKNNINKEGVDIISVLSYIGQSILEKYVLQIIDQYNLDRENLVLSGGVFYNVKLNNKILNKCKKRVEVVPCAGDQGGSIGIGVYLYRDIFKKNPSKCDLLIGRRKSGEVKLKDIEKIVNVICNGGIVNLIHGNMEFAPRALCNTSTLCLPIKENVQYINKINIRDEAMPMAPVILEKNLKYFFNEKELNKSLDSRYYMITTYLYKESVPYKDYSGVMHKLPYSNVYSGRPQVVKESSVIGKILIEVEKKINIKCLINTSYNVHGHPICFNKRDVLFNFQKQRRFDDEKRLYLYNFIKE